MNGCKMSLFALVFIFLSSLSFSQNESVVQEQLDAYNSGDIERFVDTFSDDAVFVEFSTGKVRLEGKEAIYEAFDSYFKESPDLHSTVKQRISLGKTVIDHELITGSRNRQDTLQLIMVYEVIDGKIAKATTIRE